MIFFALRIEWRLYRSFFGTNPETVDLLNEISGPTANTLARILFERVLLGLRRITSPVHTNKSQRESVTVTGLPLKFESADDELSIKISRAVQACKFAKNWSDKKIAHTDLDYKTKRAKLMSASRAKVEDAMSCTANVIKWVSIEYFGIHQVTHPTPPFNDETEFLRVLYLGLEEKKRREETVCELRRSGAHDEARTSRNEFRSFPDWLVRLDPPLDFD